VSRLSPARRSRIAAVVLALVAVVATAGCEPRVRWVSPNSGARTPPTPHPSTSASTVDWKPCPDVARAIDNNPPANMTYECGTVRVPRDWAAPADPRTFDLALLRAKVGGQQNRIGSLLLDPGGPGVSGVDLAVYLSKQVPVDVLRRFDLVGFDPRGVARSAGINCFTDDDLDHYFGDEPDPASDAEFAVLVDRRARMGRRCADRYGDGLRLYATEQSARDMERIRDALGDPKLSYLGYSYGTLLGAVYANLFPDRIRAMVLDGAVDPLLNTVDATAGQGQGFERAFDDFAAWCKANAPRCPVAPDARARVNEALASARQAPVAGPDGRRATAGWILTAVSAALYDAAAWPMLAGALDGLRGGRATGLFGLADAYVQRGSDGHYANLFDAFLTISCTDDATPISIEQVRRLQGEWRAKYPLFGAQSATALLICAQWPGKRDPYPTGPARGAPPIVVIGTTGDPATPYEQTQRLASELGVGVVLTWRGEGHTAYPQTRCVNEAVGRYLVDLVPPAAGTTCPPR
jgi:pimeloyl-ACP methyl ester carboxylesterase